MDLFDIAVAKKLAGGGGGSAVIESLSVTENGTYTAPSGVDGYSPVTVNVSGGGGGGDEFELLAEVDLGTIETSSTSSADIGKTIPCGDIRAYDMVLFVISTSKRENGYHIASMRAVWGTGILGEASGEFFGTPVVNIFQKSNGTLDRSAVSSTNGIYPTNFVVDSQNRSTATVYKKYNSSYTGTINANYTAKVYGVKLTDLI